MLKKLLISCRHFDEIARAYYGYRPWCYPKYLYYSLLRVNEFVIFRKDLKDIDPADEEPFVGTEFCICQMSIEELKKIREKQNLPKEFYCDVSHEWKKCYVVLHHGELAYIHWMCYAPDQSRFFRSKGPVAEINYNITIPRFRGHRLSIKAMHFACRTEREQGIKVIVVAVHSQNIAMIKCMKRVGFVQVGAIKSLGQWNRKVAIIASDK